MMKNKLSISFIWGVGSLLFFLLFSSTLIAQEPWKAPAEADKLKSPFPFSRSFIREGQNLYNRYCVSCHGKTGLGDGQPGRFRIEPTNFHKKSDQTDGALFWKLTTGQGRTMPAYGTALSEEKRWQLIAYLRQFSRQNTISKALLPFSNYKIDNKMPSPYFPLPGRIMNLVKSESQLFMVDTVVKGLVRPWSMVFLPDKTALIAERGGKLLLVKNGQLQDKPIGGNVPNGLRDVKLHPQFEQNKLVYISYYIEPASPEGGYSVLMRGRLEGDKLVDEKILYKGGPFKNGGGSYGSKIAFDRKGYLFLTMGIRGERKNAQDLSVPDGKTMRLKEDGSIPSDNPFVNTPGALPEIYTYGHRMHEGLIYDPKTGRILSTEFGELAGDELNVIKYGSNYGWPIVSHSLEYNGSVISASPFAEGMEPPIYHFAVAPSDFDIVYGKRYPGWDGNIFIGGLASKILLRTVFKGNVIKHQERLLENIGRIRDVKFGPDQFLYVMTEDTGVIVRLIPVSR